MRVGFHCDSFSLRGVTVATLAYARMWQQELGQESIIIKCDGQTPWIKEQPSDHRTQGLEIMRYQEPDQIHRIIKDSGIEALYLLTSGQKESRFRHLSIPLWVHAVFPSRVSDIHGSRYACISDWLAKESFNSKVPFVPHIIESSAPIPTQPRDWREQHGIPVNATVIGSMGGSHSFDLRIAQNGLHKALEQRKDLYFISLNHRPFCDHERAIFLPGTSGLGEKASFIYACDAMLHGRSQGETFGLACAEFAAAGKPVFAWRHAPERHHLENFCTPSLNYSYTNELCQKLLEIKHNECNAKIAPPSCSKFTAEVVAPQFKEVFAANPDKMAFPRFSIKDKALILKRRLQRSVRARLSQSQKQSIKIIHTAIDPITGYPIEE